MQWPVRRWIFLIGGVAILTIVCAFYWLSENYGNNYALQELFFGKRYSRYDALIVQAGERYGVDPSLIKAVIWRETRFQPDAVGLHGERGLMQVTESAARDWARAEKIETFVPTDLFDPKVNIEVGAWYLARALKQWKMKDDPIPFALAEYNAGRTRVKRWERDSGRGDDFHAEDLRAVMNFPSTKQYIHSILKQYQAFLQRGEFGREIATDAN